MTTKQIIEELKKMEGINYSYYSASKLCTKNARTRLEDLEQAVLVAIQQRDSALNKLENQEEISRDLYYERGLLQAEVQYLKNHSCEFNDDSKSTHARPEPSRLEVAAICLQGLLASGGMHIETAKIAIKYADSLIDAANYEKK